MYRKRLIRIDMAIEKKNTDKKAQVRRMKRKSDSEKAKQKQRRKRKEILL